MVTSSYCPVDVARPSCQLMFKTLRLTAAALATVALATACGSTALKSGAPAPTSPALGGGGVATTAPDGGVPDAGSLTPEAGGLPTSAPASGTAPVVGGAHGSAGRLPASSGAAARPPATSNPGPRIAPKAPIRLGVIGVNAAAIAGQFGKKVPPDTFAGIKTMIAYLNAHDGIAGHQIKPVYVRLDSGAEVEPSGQLACTALTQDNTVDMVLSLGFASETLYGCLKQRGISIFSPGGWAADAQWLAQYPNVFMPDAMRADRYTAAEIASAVKQGTLKSGDKLGVLVENCPWGNRIYDNVIAPTAQKYGVTPVKTSVTCITNLVADLGPVSQDLARDALQLATAGATHVMALTAAEGFFDSVFSQVASAQHYLPKYLVSTNANTFNTTDPKGTVHFSPDAVPNIIGLGFQPLLDVGSKAQPANAAQAAQQGACRKTDPSMGGAATDTTDGRYFKLNVFYMTCDTLFAIKSVLTANGNRFGLADMAVGFQALLAHGVSATAVGGRFGGGAFRHDGLGLAQPIAYSGVTGRPAYAGSVLSVG